MSQKKRDGHTADPDKPVYFTRERARALARRRGPPPPGRVFGYGRASTVSQQASMDLQKDEYGKYRALYLAGLEDAGWFADPDTSGGDKFREREAGKALCGHLRPGDHVVMASLDRGFRSVADMIVTVEGWAEQRISLHLVREMVNSSTEVGQAMLVMMATFAKMERSRLRERTSRAMKAKFAANPAQAPLMFKVQAKFVKWTETLAGHRKPVYKRWLVLNEYEAKVGRKVFELVLNGETYEAIAEKLTAAGVTHRPGPKGDATWGAQSVFRYYHAYRRLLESGRELPEDVRPPASLWTPPTVATPSSATPSPPPPDRGTPAGGGSCSTSP